MRKKSLKKCAESDVRVVGASQCSLGETGDGRPGRQMHFTGGKRCCCVSGRGAGGNAGAVGTGGMDLVEVNVPDPSLVGRCACGGDAVWRVGNSPFHVPFSP